jgi:hypothetical protein
VLREIFGAVREEVTGEKCMVRSFMICDAHQKLFG